MSIYAIHLNVNYGVSFIIYLVILIPILVRLNYLSAQYQDNRMKDLALAVLLAVRRECARAGKLFAVKGLPDRLRDLAALYGIEGLLTAA